MADGTLVITPFTPASSGPTSWYKNQIKYNKTGPGKPPQLAVLMRKKLRREGKASASVADLQDSESRFLIYNVLCILCVHAAQAWGLGSAVRMRQTRAMQDTCGQWIRSQPPRGNERQASKFSARNQLFFSKAWFKGTQRQALLV